MARLLAAHELPEHAERSSRALVPWHRAQRLLVEIDDARNELW